MDPTAIKGGTWQRYKLGQRQFTQWLKQTAEKLKPTGTASQENAAKANGKKAASKRETPGKHDDHVHWSQLGGMAQTIIDNSTPEDIPAAPISILRDVLSLRKRSARFFGQAAKKSKQPELQAKNAAHEHIIKVLEGSWQIGSTADATGETDEGESDVESTVTQSTKTSKKSAKEAKKKGKKGRGKPRQANGSQSHAGRQGTQQSNWVEDFDFGHAELDREDDEFDYYVMVYCFFEDFNLIRSYVCERWCDYYYDRSVTLNTLAVLTNTACELFHQMERELFRLMKFRDLDMVRYDCMMEMLFFDVGMEHIDYDSYEGLGDSDTNERIWKEEADWLGLPVYWQVEDILRHVPPGKVPMIPPSERSVPVYGATDADGLRAFQNAVVMDLLGEVAILKALKRNGQEVAVLPAESKLLLDFQESLRLKAYPSAFIFSLQLYVDIRYILEETVDHAFTQLQATATRTAAALESGMPQAVGPRIEMRREMRRRLKETHPYMLEDFTLEDRTHRFRGGGITEHLEPFSLLKRDPIWAGLLDLRAKLVVSHVGSEFAARSAFIEAAAALYFTARAVLLDSFDKPVWPEMERLAATHAETSPFRQSVLGDPANPAAILASLAQTARVPANNITGHNGTSSAAVRTTLHARFAEQEDLYRPADVMRWARELVAHRFRIDAPVLPVAAAIPATHDGLEARRTRDAERLSAVHADGGRVRLDEPAERELRRRAVLAQLSPLRMLQIMDEMVTDLVDGLLAVDYFRLYGESVGLLVGVGKAVFGDEFGNRIGYGEKEGELPDSLVNVAWILAEEVQGATEGGKKETLSKVANVVRTYVSALQPTG